MAGRKELIQAIAERYRNSSRADKKKILDEFIEVTGFHRKHAIRALRQTPLNGAPAEKALRSRIYDQAVVEALTILWEAADRICGKRLKQAIPALLEAMELHGHLDVNAEVRRRLLAIGAATIDRLLASVRNSGRQGRRRVGISTPLRKSIAVRTFSDWNDPTPGFFEMDMVAHCGKSVAGSHVHSLVLTDIASGWTVGAGMVVREQTLITVTVEEIRTSLPFPMLGLNVDNDSAFINQTLVDFCRDRGIELTRSRAYKKNDQAWIEQKNGSVVRRLVGYGRLEGVRATTVLSELHQFARLYVNFFLPSFKLKSKIRVGAKLSRQYDIPASPYKRLLASDRVSDERKEKLRRTFRGLDPVRLLNAIRERQRVLATLEVGSSERTEVPERNLNQFVASLSTAWRSGEVRPTHRKSPPGRRSWRTRVDPFEDTWPMVERWLDEEPDANAKNLLRRLQEVDPTLESVQLRTLQRRVREWRTAIARRLVLGVASSVEAEKEMITS